MTTPRTREALRQQAEAIAETHGFGECSDLKACRGTCRTSRIHARALEAIEEALLASLPVRPEQQDEEDLSRGDSVPGSQHGDLPHKPEGVLTTTAPEYDELLAALKALGAEAISELGDQHPAIVQALAAIAKAQS